MLTRGRAVDSNEMREPAKVVGGLFGRFADQGHIQASRDYRSNVSERHAFIGNSVIGGSGGAFFQREPVDVGSVEAMNGGPAIEPVVDIRGEALFPRDLNKRRNEAVVAVAMDRWRKAQHRYAHITRGHRQSSLLGDTRKIRVGRILFRCQGALTLQD